MGNGKRRPNRCCWLCRSRFPVARCRFGRCRLAGSCRARLRQGYGGQAWKLKARQGALSPAPDPAEAGPGAGRPTRI